MNLSPMLAAMLIAGSLFALVLTRQPLMEISHYTGAGVVSAAPAPVAARGGGESAPPARPKVEVVAPARREDAPLSVVGQPSVDVATIRRVLQQYNSPAVGDAEAIYQLGVDYGIDPAICLAFFIVESAAGTKGMATETRSVGNIRATPGYVNHKGYRKYTSWREGAEDWYRLITRLYVGEWSLTTVEAIVPVYAPAADNNHPESYISTVRTLVRAWRAGR
jgi:hypothetical protein